MSVLEDQKTIPGGMQDQKIRELPNGDQILYEFAPAGYLNQKGYPRVSDWRKYFYLPSDSDERLSMLSVTTLLNAVIPKGGLSYWYEARGIEGTLAAWKAGELSIESDAQDAIRTVRRLRLGADRAKQDAADRGVNVHVLLEQYMRSGEAPRISDHPAEHHGYLRALCSWLLARNPEPECVEQLVADREAGYAGRRDLVARCSEVRVGYDAKTQQRAGIFSGAHAQLRLYERAAIACGDPPCDELRIVVFAADGNWREMTCEASDECAEAAIRFAHAIRPIDALCASWNRNERKTRGNAA